MSVSLLDTRFDEAWKRTHCAAFSQTSANMPLGESTVARIASAMDTESPEIVERTWKILGTLAENFAIDCVVAAPSLSS